MQRNLRAGFTKVLGIYRHVWLDKTSPVAVAPDGIFVWSEFENNVPNGRAKINVETRLFNCLTNETRTTVQCKIIGPDGKSLANFHESETMKRQSQRIMKLESKVSSPILWSPESPKLYKLRHHGFGGRQCG